jgi:hypothetical protein
MIYEFFPMPIREVTSFTQDLAFDASNCTRGAFDVWRFWGRDRGQRLSPQF